MSGAEQKRILIVEDEKAIRKSMTYQLSKHNFNILEAGDGVEGLKVALKEHPDLLLLDILMPEMDGMEMLEKLREDSWGKNAPVMLLTNVADTTKIAEAVNLGVHDYLVKSDWQPDDVVKKIKKKLHIV